MAEVGTMISSARARPRPSAVGTRVCDSTPSSTRESWARICACCAVGKTSMMRVMVCAQELVWSVAKVR